MSKVLRLIRILCVAGLLLSAYAAYVEIKAERDANYVALCDISPKISCTAVFNTVYGKGFGLVQHIAGVESAWNQPNGFLGIGFYTLLLILTLTPNRLCVLLQLVLCVASNILSVYLAYLLYFVLADLCLICVSIYAVNFFCLMCVWSIYNSMPDYKSEVQSNWRKVN